MDSALCKDGYRRPRAYLSWSQYSCFLRSPREYAMRYLHGDNQTNPAMELGKYVAEMIEHDEEQEDEVLENLRIFLPQYQNKEFKIEAEINGVPILGKLDGFNTTPIKVGEYKTGRFWSQEMADDTEQLDWYALLVYLKFRVLPDKIPMTLTWMPTDWNGGDPQVTGEIVNFETRRSTMKVLMIGKKIVDTWKKIGIFCEDEYRSIGL